MSLFTIASRRLPMPFPLDDPLWFETRRFLEQHTQRISSILAPNEFLEFFPGNYPYSVSEFLSADHFEFVTFHKGMLSEIAPKFGQEVLRQFRPIFGNEVFSVFAKHPPLEVIPPDLDYLKPVMNHFASEEAEAAGDIAAAAPVSPVSICGIVITTRDRPDALARSLPSVVALGAAVMVVDDGSSPEHHQANQNLADRFGVPLLYWPTRRGLPAALNAGVSYWLADPAVEWISVFRDHVEVRPDAIAVLAQVQDAHLRPVLTGRDAAEHPIFGRETIAGHDISLRRSMPGIHLHAHRDYWAGVLPIPTPDLRTDTTGRGTEEDWWITAWSPRSITKQGGYVVCVPGLVKTLEEAAALDLPATTVTAPPLPEAPLTTTTAPVVSETPPAEPIVKQVAQVVERSPIAAPVQATNQPAPLAIAPELHLDNIQVLLDGYNLEMSAGTGIKTYGTSLIKALKAMGASVDVLLSRNASKSNKVLDEVLFFDNQDRDPNRLVEYIDLLKGLIKTSAGPFYRARRRKTPSGYVVTQGKYSEDFLKYAESFNLPQCYKTANSLYKYLKISTQISVPEKIDIWHATYPLPIQVRGAKKITTIHDMIPLRLPYATLDNKEHFYNTVRNAVEESDIVVSVSEHSKQDLLTYFDVDPDKIVVTYQPIALDYEEISEREVATFLRRYGLESRRYLLFVGAIEPKKNLGRLLDAYATIDTDMPLVIVGKKGWLWEDEIGRVSYLFDGTSKSKVKLLQYLPASSLSYLYRGAYSLIFPSLYEGFGLPPLEAMTFGCPVITSGVSSLPEICKSAALYVDPYDVGNIKAQIENLLSNGELRDQLAKDGRANAEFFSMENYVKRLHGAYIKALN